MIIKTFDILPETKGQLISKCPFVVFVSTKKPTRISALASKKRSNQKIIKTLYLFLII